MADKIQPYNSGGQLDVRRSPARRQHFKGSYQSGPRCPMCHSGNVQPFSTIYGLGTTNYLTHKGLFIPHGFSKTKRQSVLAAKCAPPRKMSWWPAIVAILIAALFYFSARLLMNIADILEPAGYGMLWLACASESSPRSRISSFIQPALQPGAAHSSVGSVGRPSKAETKL